MSKGSVKIKIRNGARNLFGDNPYNIDKLIALALENDWKIDVEDNSHEVPYGGIQVSNVTISDKNDPTDFFTNCFSNVDAVKIKNGLRKAKIESVNK